MPVIMFWNSARKPLAVELGAACREHRVELVILAEREMTTKEALIGLNGDGVGRYEEAFCPVPSRVRFFTNLPKDRLRPLRDADKISIRMLSPPLGGEIIVAAVHLSSKLHAENEDQDYGARRMRDMIERVEADAGHRRTVVIGDLNMSPFESGMVAADGFHAVMDKEIAAKGSRLVQGAEFGFF